MNQVQWTLTFNTLTHKPVSRFPTQTASDQSDSARNLTPDSHFRTFHNESILRITSFPYKLDCDRWAKYNAQKSKHISAPSQLELTIFGFCYFRQTKPTTKQIENRYVIPWWTEACVDFLLQRGVVWGRNSVVHRQFPERFLWSFWTCHLSLNISSIILIPEILVLQDSWGAGSSNRLIEKTFCGINLPKSRASQLNERKQPKAVSRRLHAFESEPVDIVLPEQVPRVGPRCRPAVLLAATAEAWSCWHSGVECTWEKTRLRGFCDLRAWWYGLSILFKYEHSVPISVDKWGCCSIPWHISLFQMRQVGIRFAARILFTSLSSLMRILRGYFPRISVIGN